MTRFEPRHYLAMETAISIVINLVVTTAPKLLSPRAMDALSPRSLRDVAVSLTPQFLICSFMSALVPSLLTRWRQTRGKLGSDPQTPCPSLRKTIAVAAALAASLTALVLASIHLMPPQLVDGSIAGAATLLLSGAQGILAAAVVTPLALVALFGASWTWKSRGYAFRLK